MNALAVYRLSDVYRDPFDARRRHRKRDEVGPSGDAGSSGSLEPEDEGTDESNSADTAAETDGAAAAGHPVSTHLPTAPPSTSKKGGGGGGVARSIGNSLEAAKTSPVSIADDCLRFFVIGDWGGPGREPQRDVASAMDRIATHDAQHKVQFVISTGDNMYEDGISGVHDKKLQRNYENVYTQPSLQVRWYMSLGNHDHGAHGVMRDAQAEVNYTKLSQRWFLPSTYYSQRFLVANGGSETYIVDLFVLDTYDYSPRVTQMTEAQLTWFEKALQASVKTGSHVRLVVGHRPLYSAGAKHGSSPYMQKKLEPYFAKYGVSAYMCGDDHELQVMRSKGVVHLLSGGGARAKKDLKPNGVPQTVFQAGVHGFMWVKVNRSDVDVEVYNRRAELLFHRSFSTAMLGAAAKHSHKA